MGKKGKLFVISAPSGSGKTTLCQKLIQGLSGKGRLLVRSISVTTRKPRRGEREGRDYFFISREEFKRRKRAGQFLEWAEVLGNFYGTPGEFVERNIDCGNDVLLSIDVQGALKIKRIMRRKKNYDAVFIFIMPPSYKELARRLSKRSTETKTELNQRLKLAKREMGFVKEYQYIVLNDKISQALARLKEIVLQERQD